MNDLALDPQTNDLILSGGRLEMVDGLELVAQRLRVRLNRRLGEWIWDTRRGVPWLETVFVRPPNISAISTALKSEIIGTAGVIELLAFEATRRGSALSVRFEVSADDGSGQVTRLRAAGEVTTLEPSASSLAALFILLTITPAGKIL